MFTWCLLGVFLNFYWTQDNLILLRNRKSHIPYLDLPASLVRVI